MVPIPPALDTAAARGPPEVRAMPASMIGYLIPKSLHSGVFRGGGGDDMVNFWGERAESRRDDRQDILYRTTQQLGTEKHNKRKSQTYRR
jgi:hypothetical protein